MKLCGVINVAKPAGITSRDVVDRVLKLVHPAKAGHAGTLDPMATGVLVVCVGHATRLINMAQEGRKRYTARFVLGLQTDTDDVTGTEISRQDPSSVQKADINALLPEFTGQILQVPPQYSAVHVQGRRAYDLARKGVAVEIAPRPVDVYSIRMTQFENPHFELEIDCGSGTYIRSIGRDLGVRLGCGATMSDLVRTAVGPFELSSAVPMDELNRSNLMTFLQPALKIADQLPQRILSPNELIAVRRGQSVPLSSSPVSTNRTTDEPLPVTASTTEIRTALIDADGILIGIAEADQARHRLNPRIVFPD